VGATRPDSAGEGRTGFRVAWAIALVALAITAAVVGCTRTGGWDVWWHLETGRVALERASFLPRDLFSYSFAGAPWPHKDLLADTIFQLGFSALGYASFGILKGAAAAGIALSVALAVPRAARRPDVAVILGGLALAAVQYRVVERPVLFSLALFPALLGLLERMRRGAAVEGAKPFGLLAPPSLLVWLWVWLHREAVLGLAVFGAYVAALWVARLFGGGSMSAVLGPAPRSRFHVWATLALAVTAGLSLLNPSGIHFFTTGLALAGSDVMRQIITDWARIGLRELIASFPVSAALIAAALLACTARLVVAWRKRDRTSPVALLHLALVAAFTAATLGDCVRWLPFASSMAAIALALCVSGAASSEAARPRASHRVAVATTALAGMALIGLLVARDSFGFGVGPMEDRFPAGAMAFAREHRLGPKVFNSFHLGGYAIWGGWPRFAVLVDSRNDTVYPPSHVASAVRAQVDRRAFGTLLARYGGDWVLASNLPGHVSFPFLAHDREWMMAYWSEPAVVYVRRSEGRELGQLELKHVDPRAVDGSIADATISNLADPAELSSIEREVVRMRVASPTGVRSNAAAAVHYHLRGRAFDARRDAALEVLWRRHRGEPAVEELFRRMGVGSAASPGVVR
jgi:hypothetical protein